MGFVLFGGFLVSAEGASIFQLASLSNEGQAYPGVFPRTSSVVWLYLRVGNSISMGLLMLGELRS
jgi:hypothetical protein